MSTLLDSWEADSSLSPLLTGPLTMDVAMCELVALVIVWSGFGLIEPFMLSDSVALSVVCRGLTGLSSFVPIFWFDLDALSSGVPGVLESANICGSIASAVYDFAGEGCVGGLEYIPGARVLWKEACEIVHSGVRVSCCASS